MEDRGVGMNIKVLEENTKQLNSYGNGIGVLVSREAKSIGLKSGDKVRVTSVLIDGKKYIVVQSTDQDSD